MPINSDPASLRESILGSVSDDERSAIERLATVAAPAHVYAVGGAARDAILGRPITDIDLALEGDAIDIAVAAFPRSRITTHARFRTASLMIDGTRIDIATARSENYARPGALPKVTPADIETDLRRRDFTVNATALRLDGSPALIDPCDGIADIRAKRIRVLHDASFRDDATRIFRAFRYAARLGLEIEPHTLTLLDAGIACISTIGGERLRNELELIFEEDCASDALKQCDHSGALRAIHPSLAWPSSPSPSGGGGWGEGFPGDHRSPFHFALLVANATTTDAAEITTRLKLKRAQAAAVAAMPALRSLADALARPQAKPSGITVLLDRYPLDAVEAFASIAGDSIAGQVARRYLAEWRATKPALNGRDLIELGVPEGPRLAQALQLLRAARLDGWATERDDERVLIARFVKSIRDSSAMTAPIELHTNGH